MELKAGADISMSSLLFARSKALLAGVAALAIAVGSPLRVHAGGAADAIADKFAADRAGETPANEAGADNDSKWLHEEARRAVERALQQDDKPRVHEAQDAQQDATVQKQEPVEPKVTESATEPTKIQPAAEFPQDTSVPESQPAAGRELDLEGKELAEKLRELRRKRISGEADPAAPPTSETIQEPGLVEKAVSGIASQVSDYISPLIEKRVSILIVMEVGKKGVRTWSKTADPMLCIHESCYLSRGAGTAAEKLTRSVAFGPSVALGKRGQACRSKPACIFRDIDMETVEAKLQPIDLRFLRHDRREAKAIRADATCAILEGKLSCRSPVSGDGWRAWIVPESVAEKAGAQRLEAAMARGLE